MASPDLTGLTATFRKPPSFWWYLPFLLVVGIGTFLGSQISDHATIGVKVIAWVGYVCVSGIVGLGIRWLQPAVRLVEAGVEKRSLASTWHLIPWDEVEGVDARPHSVGDPFLRLRGGGEIALPGMVPATAEVLAGRLTDRNRAVE